jgi:hypothetical protein
MIPVEAAITRVRRDLTLGILLKIVLACAAAACLLLAPENARIAALLAVGSIWFWLSLTSARSSRSSAASPSLIAAGQFDEAERNIEQTVRTFSLFRAVKLQSLHHLALLRHAQRRWPESAALCRALLGQRLGTLQPLAKPASLLLADSTLEMNDLRGAHEAIARLYQQPLSLAETLTLLSIEVDYLARIGAWDRMMENVMHKVQLAELMPAGASARTQGLLALAAKKLGRNDFADWLRARAVLLADADKIIAERPMLQEVLSTQH